MNKGIVVPFSTKEFDPFHDRLITIQDHYPARLIYTGLHGSSFQNIFLVDVDGRDKIILANSAGITGSRDRKYDIGIEKNV